MEGREAGQQRAARSRLKSSAADSSTPADVVRKPSEARKSISRKEQAEGSSELVQGQESFMFTPARVKHFRMEDRRLLSQ